MKLPFPVDRFTHPGRTPPAELKHSSVRLTLKHQRGKTKCGECVNKAENQKSGRDGGTVCTGKRFWEKTDGGWCSELLLVGTSWLHADLAAVHYLGTSTTASHQESLMPRFGSQKTLATLMRHSTWANCSIFSKHVGTSALSVNG